MRLSLIAVLALLPGLRLAAQQETPPAPDAKPEAAPDKKPGDDKKPDDPRRHWLEPFREGLRRPAPGGESAEPAADPLKALDEAAKLMGEAEEDLHGAAAHAAQLKGSGAEQKLDGGTPPKGRQAEEKLNKLLGEADGKQKKTIELFNVLIRQAQQQQQQSNTPNPQQSQPKQGQNPQPNQPNRGNRAQQPYTPPPASSGSPPTRSSDRADRWGDLPPQLRDPANQALREVEEFPSEYKDLLLEYYKRLAGGE